MSSNRGACGSGTAKKIRVVFPITSILLSNDAQDCVLVIISGMVVAGMVDVSSGYR